MGYSGCFPFVDTNTKPGFNILSFLVIEPQPQPGPTPVKAYRICLRITNKAAKDALLRWQQPQSNANHQAMEDKQLKIPKFAFIADNITVFSAQQPNEIEFNVCEEETTNVMKINGKDKILISPLENAPSTSVTVSEGMLRQDDLQLLLVLYLSITSLEKIGEHIEHKRMTPFGSIHDIITEISFTDTWVYC